MKQVLYEVSDRVAYITLNRPEKRNALNSELVTELLDAFERVEQDETAKVVVLNAKGDAFCAGADLSYLQKLQSNSFDENLLDSNHLKALFFKIYSLEKVVIAQVQGHALAGGCGLATVCDFIYASELSKFGYTEVRIGFIPAIVSVFLVRKIGEQRARQLLLSGEPIHAREAFQLGMVTQVVASNDLEEKVNHLARQLVMKNSGQSMKLTKQLIAQSQSLNLIDALDFAANMNAHARAADDCKRGIDAFLNKTDLKW